MNFAELLDQAPHMADSPLVAGLRPITVVTPDLAATEVADVHAGRAPRPGPVTVAVLTHNEAEHIGACLAALSQDADRILLVDAESTDGTIEQARRVRPDLEVLSAPWRDDFAHQRNLALSQVREGWVVFVDADEVLAAEDAGRLRDALCALDQLLPAEDFSVSPRIVDVDGTGYSDNRRILRAGTRYRYRGRIHEKPYDEAGCPPARVYLDVRFNHFGYTPEAMERKAKRRRNRRLLDLCRQEEPENATWVYYLIRDTTDFRTTGADRLRARFEELRSAVDRPLPEDAPARLTERHVDAWALLCQLALGFGGTAEVKEYAERLDSVGRKVDAAYFTTLMESSRVLGRLSDLADRIAEAGAWETLDNRHLVGRLYEVQATVALASGRYDLVPDACRAARERGAGSGLAEDLTRLRELLGTLDAPRVRQSS
ncbi:glycosyltransferase [Streptomyces sp. KLOTTS4A1]|uniref:glycosyltransferase n=1 Tax=Streptomyces sp. KLOTTS4A1 TaxID=3390996 RepID=UPI0039F5BC5A